MIDQIKKYLKNIKKVISLDNLNEVRHCEKEKLFSILLKNAEMKHSLAEENNQVIKDVLVPLEQKKNLSIEERTNIEFFIEHLQEGFESKDNGMLYRLYHLLLEDALLGNDFNRIVYCIYYNAYYEYILQSTYPREKRTNFFETILQYKEHYNELNVEGKKFFLRCYGNQMLTKEYSYSTFKKIVDFIIDKKKNDPNPEIPYDAYLLATYKNICNGIETIRNNDTLGIKTPDEVLDGIYEAACHIQEDMKNVENTSLPIQQIYAYVYHAIKFHKGMITIDEFLNELDKLTVVKKNYTIQQKSACIIKMNSYILFYLKYKEKDKDMLKEKIMNRISEVLQFVKTIKPSDYTRNMNADLISFIKMTVSYYSYDELENLFLIATSKRHIPTMIHSQSVAELSKILTKEMLDKNPEFFVGIADNYSLSYIQSHKEEIIDLSYHMGLMHDIGKYYCIPFISINYRKLEDAEFETVKNHPYFGYTLARKAIPAPIRDGILYHHLWHNGQGGYPKGYDHTQNLPLVDILSVCDSIDAAVDFLGRNYTHSKTIEDLVEEFQQCKGTRYAKEVVELFDNPNIVLEVKKFLDEERPNIVYQAFSSD